MKIGYYVSGTIGKGAVILSDLVYKRTDNVEGETTHVMTLATYKCTACNVITVLI